MIPLSESLLYLVGLSHLSLWSPFSFLSSSRSFDLDFERERDRDREREREAERALAFSTERDLEQKQS